MLISDSMQKIIRVLLNTKKTSVRKIAGEAGVSLGISVKILNQLEKTGYLSRKKNGFEAINLRDLLSAWAYVVSVKEKRKIEFVGAENPQYLIKKISSIGNRNKLEYAFTLFAGAELVYPLVAPNEVHLYIPENERDKWERALKKEKIFPAEKGNIVCFDVDKSYFYGKIKIRDIGVISLPQLYTDLFSIGGRGRELSEEILKLYLSEARKNV